jgi:hypothetical protein
MLANRTARFVVWLEVPGKVQRRLSEKLKARAITAAKTEAKRNGTPPATATAKAPMFTAFWTMPTTAKRRN